MNRKWTAGLAAAATALWVSCAGATDSGFYVGLGAGQVNMQDQTANPNGAANNIAGICNAARNVVGLMPHPERACEPTLGSADGLILFQSVLQSLAVSGKA